MWPNKPKLRCPEGHTWNPWTRSAFLRHDGMLACPICGGVIHAHVAARPQEAEDQDYNVSVWTTRLSVWPMWPLVAFAVWFSIGRNFIPYVEYAPGDQGLAIVTKYFTEIHLIDTETGAVREKYTGTVPVSGVAFSRDGQLLAVSGKQYPLTARGTRTSGHPAIGIWNVQPGRYIRTLSGPPGPLTQFTFARGDSRLYSVGLDGKICEWQFGQPAPHYLGRLPITCRTAALSPDDKSLAIGEDSGEVSLLSPSGDKKFWVTECSSSPVVALDFSPDGQSLAVGGQFDRSIQIVSKQAGQTLRTYSVPMTWIMKVAFAPDGKRFAVGGGSFPGSGQAIVFDIDTPTPLYAFKVPTNTVWSVSFSPDGKRLAAGTGVSASVLNRQWCGQWYQWDLETGQRINSGN
jgi:WD40 repeat protein